MLGLLGLVPLLCYITLSLVLLGLVGCGGKKKTTTANQPKDSTAIEDSTNKKTEVTNSELDSNLMNPPPLHLDPNAKISGNKLSAVKDAPPQTNGDDQANQRDQPAPSRSNDPSTMTRTEPNSAVNAKTMPKSINESGPVAAQSLSGRPKSGKSACTQTGGDVTMGSDKEKDTQDKTQANTLAQPPLPQPDTKQTKPPPPKENTKQSAVHSDFL